ncbi:hypothetical protein F4703DRAFT_1919815 [Phycomyces blakesleeanus]|uniref:Uncharacterized protein n=1 Tax=Phycomyces blakesleeanus (strain ATCC 8743b / DSM 1359 / FGSC 10004 / NBRC 33097 / NRRL 1555) TaxID=763407 RepID=A0A163CT51_PHYB8|nr:hypothetical protein PHYBLDRAFT_176186 [Phycomyces blakesleeanus NRRL 1555(-)]OAD65420.1 hypothetical protein PHYBLDRAFT_176186 [Phycomyces blakesleeanus NRRL 1555(-)]|eukprot:XP_018283460.1 hypothetical protein PHYBLDRAFT_176186 [Phycomyces blakesleeanus NRRL 1555(-)]
MTKLTMFSVYFVEKLFLNKVNRKDIQFCHFRQHFLGLEKNDRTFFLSSYTISNIIISQTQLQRYKGGSLICYKALSQIREGLKRLTCKHGSMTLCLSQYLWVTKNFLLCWANKMKETVRQIRPDDIVFIIVQFKKKDNHPIFSSRVNATGFRLILFVNQEYDRCFHTMLEIGQFNVPNSGITLFVHHA